MVSGTILGAGTVTEERSPPSLIICSVPPACGKPLAMPHKRSPRFEPEGAVKMRVLLSTYGSRGDVQPMAGLGLALQKLGAEALISAPSDAEFVALLDR